MSWHLTARPAMERGRASRAIVLTLAALLVGGCWWRPSPDPPSPTSETLTPDLADLTITSATVEILSNPDACNGSTTCLIVTVANLGKVDAHGLDDGCGTYSFGDPAPFASFAVGASVPAGESVTFRSGYFVLEPHLPATFLLECEIDAAGRIAESNEGNNTYSVSLSR